jgi:DNA mismatch repair protein MutS
VIRVVTPGTLTEDTLLDARENNYLCAAAEVGGEYALAWIDLSTGDFAAQAVSLPALPAAVERLNAREILIPDRPESAIFKNLVSFGAALSPQSASLFDSGNAQNRLEEMFGVGTRCNPLAIFPARKSRRRERSSITSTARRWENCRA